MISSYSVTEAKLCGNRPQQDELVTRVKTKDSLEEENLE